MQDIKLIIFEGIPGSGKTTTSKQLHEYFVENDIKSTLFVEGSKHPIDLPFYAYLNTNEFDELLNKYVEQSDWLKKNSIVEDEYILVPYKNQTSVPFDKVLIDYLSSKEICYSSNPVVSYDEFKNIFIRRFKKYVNEMKCSDVVTIFESVIFQHQIHDINRLYPNVEDVEIIDYLRNLAKILTPLNPVLFYISQNNVEESLRQTANIRSKPKWGTKETIDYYKKRKNIELKALENIALNSEIIDNSDYDWVKMFNNIIHILDVGA